MAGWPVCAGRRSLGTPLCHALPTAEPGQAPASDVCETRPCRSDGHHHGVGLGGASPLAPPSAERPASSSITDGGWCSGPGWRLVGRRG